MVYILQYGEHLLEINILLYVGKAISGPQLASLLEILVMAANEGSMAEVRRLLSGL